MSRRKVERDSPIDVGKSCDRIGLLMPALAREYIEGHAYGFVQKDRRSAHMDATAADDKGNRTQQERVSTSEVSDPTPNLAIEQEYTRRKVAEAAQEIFEAERMLFAAHAKLGKLFKSEDEWEPLRETMLAGDRAPGNVRRDLDERESYLSKALAEVRQERRRAS